MIGRYDVIFDIASPAEFAEQILQLVQVEWPDCIAENPLTGESLRQAMLGLAKMPHQVFVYRDAQSKASWEEHGAVPQNRHSMIHLALDATSLAVVVDDPSESQTASFLTSIDQIARDLRQLRFEVAA